MFIVVIIDTCLLFLLLFIVIVYDTCLLLLLLTHVYCCCYCYCLLTHVYYVNSEIQELLHVSFGRSDISSDDDNNPHSKSSSPTRHGYGSPPVCYLLVVRYSLIHFYYCSIVLSN